MRRGRSSWPSSLLRNEVGLSPGLASLLPCLLSVFSSPPLSLFAFCLSAYLCMYACIYLRVFPSLSTLSTDVCLSISLSVFIFFLCILLFIIDHQPLLTCPPPPVGGLSHCCSIPLAYIMLFHRARLPRF